jgi:hypothetical protein
MNKTTQASGKLQQVAEPAIRTAMHAHRRLFIGRALASVSPVQPERFLDRTNPPRVHGEPASIGLQRGESYRSAGMAPVATGANRKRGFMQRLAAAAFDQSHQADLVLAQRASPNSRTRFRLRIVRSSFWHRPAPASSARLCIRFCASRGEVTDVQVRQLCVPNYLTVISPVGSTWIVKIGISIALYMLYLCVSFLALLCLLGDFIELLNHRSVDVHLRI